MSRSFTLRGLAYSALFAALVVVFGFVSIPLGFTPVPITLQTLAVMLAGGLLGARYGFFSLMMVVVLVALGFPLLKGDGGIDKLLGPTGGYVVMWPVAALIIGWLVSKVRSNDWKGYILVFLIMECFGSLLLYVTGVPWLAYAAALPMEKALAGGFYPFILGDAIKAVAATIITITVRQLFPQTRLTGTSYYGVKQAVTK
ncbi:biotin biosynthesis protein BioY [Paenibacillus swuensis]|uniref:Biotin transporter n=1 Tax=Paenibacillus swuensis TaxID=1178515 RepID=A0A172TL34_9BACL|nr:biotin transporter BioY [Paenibacillus swuensis]ANE47692.1 biotin biosynthesis protein BioY [Paenibacillus swuensis]